MIAYHPGCDVGLLEDWPFEAPASAYQILRGTPRASGRLDAGGPGHTTRFGIWKCTQGAFACTEQGDELMTILSGCGTLIDHADGAQMRLEPGLSLFVRDGSRVTWEIDEDLTKVFHGFKPDGF